MIFIILNLLILATLAFIIYHQKTQDIQELCYREIEAIGNTLLPYIDGDLHKKLTTTHLSKDTISQKNTPSEYTTLVKPMVNAHRVNSLNTPIYTLILDEQLRDSISANPQHHREHGTRFIAFSNGIYYRHPYEYKPEMAQTFFEGASVRLAPYRDENGEWISIYLPIKNSSGTIVGLLELDKKMSDLYTANTQALIELLLVLAIISIISTMLLIIIAKKITRPIQRLTMAAQQFGEGDYGSEISATSRDEIGTLALVIENARLEISEFIQRILNVVPGLMLIIDQKGEIQKHSSRTTRDLFNNGKELQGIDVDSALFKGEPVLKELTTMAFNPALIVPFSDILELAPHEIATDKGTFELTYIPISRDDVLSGIFLFGRDVSKERDLSQQIEQENRHNKMLISIIKNRNLFNTFVGESHSGIVKAKELLKESVTQESINELFRITHTIKGNGASLNLFELTDFTHGFENDLSEYRDTGTISDRASTINAYTHIEELLDQLNTQVEDLIGKQENYFTLQEHEFTQIQDSLKQGDIQHATTMLQEITKPLLADYVSLKAHAIFDQTIEQLDSKEAVLELNITDIRIDQRYIKVLDSILPHLIRNALDHGLEESIERQEQGKNAEGTVSVSIKKTDTALNLTMGDDGGGISPEAVKEHALNKGVITKDAAQQLSDHEAQSLIFAPGFSTAEGVTAISGRGVGMDSVRELIERTEGSITLSSVVGKGTTFEIVIPIA